MHRNRWIFGLCLAVVSWIGLGIWSGAALAAEELPDVSAAGIGVMTGSTAEAYLEKTYSDAKISRFDNIADGVTALQGGKIDYVLTAYTTALNYVRNNNDIFIYGDHLIEESVAIAVKKENTQLLDQIDGILAEFETDGTLDEVISHWIKEDGSAYNPAATAPVKEDAGWLDVGIAANREPMCFVKDNEFAGLDCELIERIAARMGKKVRYSDMQFSSLIAALESEKVDVVISNMTATEERRKKVGFTRDYFDNPQVLIARMQESSGKESGSGTSFIPEFTSYEQLAGKKVGVLTGSVFDAMLGKFIPEAYPEYFNNNTDMAVALAAGKIDGFLTDEPIARSMAAGRNDIVYLPEFLTHEKYAFIFSKENEALVEEVSLLVKEMKEDGTLDALDEKWFGADESLKTLPKEETSKGEKSKTLKVAVDSASPPFTYISNGEVVGYDVEVLQKICERLGYDLEISGLEFAAVIPGVISGKFDAGVGCITITEERAQSVLFAEPDYEGGVVMMVRSKGQEEGTSFFKSIGESFNKTFIREDRWKLIGKGLGITCLISIASAVTGSILGFGLCMMRCSKNRLSGGLAKAFVKLIQGTPIVVILMILYYVVFSGKLSLDPVIVAVIGFSVNFGAYVSEMMRTGIDAVDKGQIEAASAMGYGKAAVFWKVTFPQAARHFLPVYRGEFVSMVKMTSVVGYIAIQDLTKAGDIVRSRTYEAFFPLIATAVIYFLLSSFLASALNFVENATDPQKRRHGKVKQNK